MIYIGGNRVHIDEIDSTNLELKRKAVHQFIPNGTLLTASFQTAGKGQMGAIWESQKGKNLLATYYLEMDLELVDAFSLNMIMSLAVKETIDKTKIVSRTKTEQNFSVDAGSSLNSFKGYIYSILTVLITIIICILYYVLAGLVMNLILYYLFKGQVRDIDDFLSNRSLNLTATLDKELAYKNSDFIIIATPTDYDPQHNNFDTSSVDSAIQDALYFNPNATIVIKSTVPVGFTNSAKKKFDCNNIIFSPEFLREGSALHDNLYPSRIIVGEKSKNAEIIRVMLSGKKPITIEY